jgi:O-antigen ligase
MVELKKDYLKEYKIFNFILFLWIAFMPMKNSIYQASVVLMIIMFIYHIKVFNSIDIIKNIIIENKSIFIAFSFIFISMIVSSLLGVNVSSSLLDSIKFVYRYIVVFLLLLYFYKMNFFTKKLIIIFIVSSLSIYALDGLYQFFIGVDFFKNNELFNNGLTGPIFNRTIFGFIMSILAIIVFSILFNELSKNSYLYKINIVIFILALFNMLFSLARASWVLFGVFAILLMIYNLKNNKIKTQHIYMFLAIVIFAIILFLTSDELMTRMKLLLSGYSTSRVDLWLKTLPYIYNNIIFGYGIDTYVMVVKDNFAGIHNVTLEILFFLGTVGLIVYLNFFRVIFKYILLTKQYIYGFFLIAFLIMLQVDGSLIYSKLDLSILMILLFFIYSYKIDSHKIKENR